jgi:hypothetical protein
VDRGMNVKRRPMRSVLLAAASALAVVGCQPANTPTSVSSAPAPLAALPLANSAAPPSAPAPTAAELPPAPPAQVGALANAGDVYAYADNAEAMNEGFGDAPPDYAVDYGGEQPWVWQANDQSARIAETLPDGSDRYYYYEPGQDAPYLVRDEGYSYGFDGGVLVVIYGPDGRALGRDEMERRADYAGRFLARGRDVFGAARRQRREAIDEANWRARRGEIDSEQQQWQSARQADPDWRDYHQAHAQQDDAAWAAERYRREAEAARYDQQANDAQQAARDWQAAQAAQALAARNNALGQQAAGNRGGLFGFGRPPAPPNPPQQPQVLPVGPRSFVNGAPANPGALAQEQAAAARAQALAVAQAAAARQAQLQAATSHQAQMQAAAQAAAAHQEQIQAAAAAAARQAQLQALSSRQAQIEAAQAAAARQAQAQALAARQAQIQAQTAAAHQAQIQAAQAAARQAQLQAIQAAQAAAARQAQIQAGQAAAQAAAARQAQIQAGQAAAQAAATHQAQIQAAAARQAQIQAAQAAAAAARAKLQQGNTTTNVH